MSPETLLELADLGLSGEQLAGVLRILARQMQESDDRKERQAERKRRQREKQENSVTVARHSRDSHGDIDTQKAPPFSPPSFSPEPPKPTPPISPPKAALLGGREGDLYAALGQLADQRANGHFLVLSEPLHWLGSGCDLDLDVLPTIKSLVAKTKGGIRSWSYFSQAVLEARDRRLAPVSEVIPRNMSPPKVVSIRRGAASIAMEMAMEAQERENDTTPDNQ